jgi:DNA-binding transcriptional ArsR family regulator
MIRPVHLIPLKARLFRSMSDEGRLEVLECLVSSGEVRVSELVERTGQSQPTVSTHLSTLYAAGLVARRPDGRQVRYSLAHPSVVTLLDASEQVVVATSEQEYACVSPCCNG